MKSKEYWLPGFNEFSLNVQSSSSFSGRLACVAPVEVQVPRNVFQTAEELFSNCDSLSTFVRVAAIAGCSATADEAPLPIHKNPATKNNIVKARPVNAE